MVSPLFFFFPAWLAPVFCMAGAAKHEKAPPLSPGICQGQRDGAEHSPVSLRGTTRIPLRAALSI
jgi:hypothetical protein